jgi:DNA-directed RNA polymerase specialized sigma24 family protein
MPQSLRGARRFPTTRWSLVRLAGGARSDAADEALSAVCETYWYPLYAYLRGRGVPSPDAQDLTQGFLTRVIEKRALAHADPARGRFRSFLLASLMHHVANERDRASAHKRGGPHLDLAGAEVRYQLEPHSELTPERLFERRWAIALLSRVLASLRGEFAAAGKETTFHTLKRWLTGNGASYREAADTLGISEPAARVAVHRMRRRYHALLRAEVATTVATPRDVDDEIAYLRRAIHGPLES